jgi:hypothetical protein
MRRTMKAIACLGHGSEQGAGGLETPAGGPTPVLFWVRSRRRPERQDRRFDRVKTERPALQLVGSLADQAAEDDRPVAERGTEIP